MAEGARGEFYDWKRALRPAAGLAGSMLLGCMICVLGVIVDPRQFAFSWLFAFAFFFTVSAGALVWILVHHAVDAEWSVVVRRQLENLAGLLPAFLLLFLPLLPLGGRLYTWLGPGGVSGDPALAHKAPFLNGGVFVFGSIGLLLFFGGLGVALRMLSVRQDARGEPVWTLRCRRVTFPAIPVFAVALTLASVLWLMALDPAWFSTMWGVYIFAGSAVSGVAALVLVIAGLLSLGYLRRVITEEHFHVMGKLLFAFSVFWAYIGYGQYFLIWYANIPEETYHFLRRNTEDWHTLSVVLVVGHFLVPFLVLLARGPKRHRVLLPLVAAWVLLMHAVDLYLAVLPELHPLGIAPHWLDLACFLTIGSFLGLLFLCLISTASLYPCRDPRLPESLRLTN